MLPREVRRTDRCSNHQDRKNILCPSPGIHQAAQHHRGYSRNGVGQRTEINAALSPWICGYIALTSTLCVTTLVLLTNRSRQSVAVGHRLRYPQDAPLRGEIPNVAEHVGVVRSRGTGGSKGRDGLIGYRTV